MLIARLMPPESSSFKKGAEFVKKYDNCIASKVPLQLFGLWSLFFCRIKFRRWEYRSLRLLGRLWIFAGRFRAFPFNGDIYACSSSEKNHKFIIAYPK